MADSSLLDLLRSLEVTWQQGKSGEDNDLTNQFNTPLGPPGQASYESWRKGISKNKQNTWDYDVPGYFHKNGPVDFSDPTRHMTDEFKKPNHPLFSEESVYSTPQHPGGRWVGDNHDWFLSPQLSQQVDMTSPLIQAITGVNLSDRNSTARSDLYRAIMGGL